MGGLFIKRIKSLHVCCWAFSSGADLPETAGMPQKATCGCLGLDKKPTRLPKKFHAKLLHKRMMSQPSCGSGSVQFLNWPGETE